MRREFLLLTILLFFFTPVLREKTIPFRGLASSWNMIPSQSLAGLYYLFKGYTVDPEDGLVRVSGPVVIMTNGEKFGAKVHPEGFTAEVLDEDFEEESKLAESVFESSTRLGHKVGTAFLVGKNLVLTNRHVMNYTPKDRKWECGLFSVKLNDRDERVKCRRVRYCSLRYDYCVVEMENLDSGEALGERYRPLRLALRMKTDRDERVLHIGNAGGMGIQASHGIGVLVEGGEFIHFAPTLGGSSGAPIFNERREVIGINSRGSEDLGDYSHCRGILSETIHNELRLTHPVTFKEIKSFRTGRAGRARILSPR
ncbi:MAG: trypsin-like serine peptidase [Bacteriovoracaceae bacterium]